MKRDWTDAKFEVVSEAPPKPKRWDPFEGLGPIKSLILAVGVGVVLYFLKEWITPPITWAVDWLLAVTGIAASHP